MSQTQTAEERRSALDEFAKMELPESKGELTVMPTYAPPTDLVHGAQEVAVRRDVGRVLTEIRELAAAAGEDWYYRFPVKNRRENRIDYIEGPTIKCANDIARIYGNCEVTCEGIDLGTVFLYRARFIDLETGFSMSRPFQQRKSAAKMGKDSERNEDAAYQTGASKAIRNVVVNALRTYADYAFAEAKQSLVAKIGRNLDQWRARTITHVSSKVDIKRVERVIGRPATEWLAPDIARVVEMLNSVLDGMAAMDDTFPPLDRPETDEREMVKADLDQFAAGGEGVVNQRPAEQGGRPNDAAERSQAAGAAPAGEEKSEPVAPAADDEGKRKADAIGEVMRIARDTSHPVEQRLEQLTHIEPQLLDGGLRTPFVKQLLATAGKVARAELKVEAALKYLRAL